jgi:predicted phage tail protein
MAWRVRHRALRASQPATFALRRAVLPAAGALLAGFLMVIAAAPATAAVRAASGRSAAASGATALSVGLIGAGLLLLGVACLVFAVEPRPARQAHSVRRPRHRRQNVPNYPEPPSNHPHRRDDRRAP